VKLHPKWWTSWGFQKLDKELTKIVKKKNIEQTWDDIINVENFKKFTTSKQYSSPKGTCYSSHWLLLSL
jgi:hypothetical protein